MTYAVNFETTPRVIAVKLSTGGMMHASFGSVQYVNTGKELMAPLFTPLWRAMSAP